MCWGLGSNSGGEDPGEQVASGSSAPVLPSLLATLQSPHHRGPPGGMPSSGKCTPPVTGCGQKTPERLSILILSLKKSHLLCLYVHNVHFIRCGSRKEEVETQRWGDLIRSLERRPCWLLCPRGSCDHGPCPVVLLGLHTGSPGWLWEEGGAGGRVVIPQASSPPSVGLPRSLTPLPEGPASLQSASRLHSAL